MMEKVTKRTFIPRKSVEDIPGTFNGAFKEMYGGRTKFIEIDWLNDVYALHENYCTVMNYLIKDKNKVEIIGTQENIIKTRHHLESMLKNWLLDRVEG